MAFTPMMNPKFPQLLYGPLAYYSQDICSAAEKRGNCNTLSPAQKGVLDSCHFPSVIGTLSPVARPGHVRSYKDVNKKMTRKWEVV